MSDLMMYHTGAVESDHDVTLIVPGDPETVRARLPQALERLGYKVIGEQPLLAKRGPVGGAQYACSFEPLDYPTKLTVGLRPLNQMASSVTFSYEVKCYGWGLFVGDCDTLKREAEAIAALAVQGSGAVSCRACGTEVTDDSRFCRRCGAVLTTDAPELEIYRLTRGTRAGLRDVGFGLIMLLLPLFGALALLVIAPGLSHKANTFLTIILSMVAAFGAWAVIEGLWELYRTANPKEAKGNFTSFTERPAATPPALAGAPLNALPPRPARFSVTEATTGLLTPEPIRPSLFNETRDTAEMEEVPRARRASGDI